MADVPRRHGIRGTPDSFRRLTDRRRGRAIAKDPEITETQGTRVTAPVENADLFPTLVERVAPGVTIPGDLDGSSFHHLLRGSTSPRTFSFSAQGTLRTVDDGSHKLIYDLASQNSLLFDVRADPDEQHELGDEEPAVRAELQRVVLEHITKEEGPGARRRAARVAKRAEEALRQLGYLE